MEQNNPNSSLQNSLTSPHLLPVHKRFNINFSHGQGLYLFGNKANNPLVEKYLDLGAGIAVNSLGHCHPKMVEALCNQAQKLWHISNIYNSNQLNCYANNLIAQTFADFVFFCNSGAESIECAIKIIRRHFFVKNEPQKYRIITFKGAFHGRTIATISAAAKAKYLEGFTPALDGFDNVEFNNIEAVKKAISPQTAGILIEPIQGEEGIRVASKEFLQELKNLCNQHNLLLAFDEVQCGMGRTGKLFAYQYFGVEPHILSTAKGIGGGFPLGACLANKNVATSMTPGCHGTTFGGNPLAMAVAMAVLEQIIAPNFLQEVEQNGNLLKLQLANLQKQFPHIIDQIRGVGLMLGIKINNNFDNNLVVEKLIEHKLLTIPAGENVIRILPALILNQNHINEAIEKLSNCFSQITQNV